MAKKLAKPLIMLLVAGVLAGIIVFVAALLTLLNFLLQPVVDASESFLRQIGEARVHEAYGQTTSDFRQGVSEGALGRLVVSSGLGPQNRIARFDWSSRSIRNGQGRLIGTIHTAADDEIPVTVYLRQENEVWKVTALELQSRDASSFEGEAQAP